MSPRTVAEPGLDVGCGREIGEAALGLGAGRRRLVAAGDQARARLGERRHAGGVAAGLPLGIGVLFARGGGGFLKVAPRGAGLGLGFGGSANFRFGGLDRGALGIDLATDRQQLRFDIGEAVLAGEPPCRARRRIRGDRESVPTPEVAVPGSQPLAGLEQGDETRCVGAVDHADLREAAREFVRRLDVLAEQLDAVRQSRIVRLDRGAGPAHGRGGIDRRFEIVAERRAERGFVALGDGDVVDHRRPETLGVDMEEFCQRLRFGIEPLHALLGFEQRATRHLDRLPRAGMRGLGAHRDGLRLRDRGLRGVGGLRQRHQVGPAGRARAELRQFCLDAGQLFVEAPPALALGIKRRLQLIAPRGEVGERSGQFCERLLGRREHGVRLGDTDVGVGPLRCVGVRLAFERLLFGDEARQRRFGVGGLPALALDIGGKLDQPLVELDHAVLGARLFLFECFARDHQPLQGRGGPGFGVTQRRHGGRRFRLAGGGLRLRAGPLADHADGKVAAMLGFRQFGIGADPAQMEQRGFGGTHLRCDVAIADRLARLLFERVDLAAELVDDVLDAREVLLGRAQPQFRLVAPCMQAGNAGGLFEHAAALLRLRLDDLADAALVHQGRRTRTGRGVGEQDVDVAGAHLAAVDAIARTLFALDPARNVERLRAR